MTRLEAIDIVINMGRDIPADAPYSYIAMLEALGLLKFEEKSKYDYIEYNLAVENVIAKYTIYWSKVIEGLREAGYKIVKSS